VTAHKQLTLWRAGRCLSGSAAS